MGHRVLMLGAGYAGLTAARRLAALLRRTDTEITLINDRPDFVERLRLHQVAAGQDLPSHDLADLLSGTSVRLRVARVSAVDAEARTVVADGTAFAYDTLVYALGSAAAPMPGAGDVWNAASPAAAMRLRDRLARAGAGERVLVAGGGLTGIELATEIAESRPDLPVTLATGGELGDWLAPAAQRHLRRRLHHLGIRTREGVRIERFTPDGAVTGDGTLLAADLPIAATGFRANPIAAAAGLDAAPSGQVAVDAAMRSLSHPDVYVIGDAAWANGPGGRPLRMSCSSGMPTAWIAAGDLAARLTDRRPSRLRVRYFHQAISLGRSDAVVQFVTADDRPKRAVLTGPAAVRYKEALCRTGVWAVAHDLPARPKPAKRPTTSGLPAR
ncbi:NAD(P)/FAD-dependent oxidoreductase [Glycomyces terrestris]|uniref:Oxidoreductase n=1 Tax=Glycomyces terrestris TaxID=2493553 RepID=A0A426UWC1_9ACTN|nr:FAD-dependent oxidoreductase [Glycomyces terrestris]RRR98489.1 oxidoreductase [Glycomyces terrestris]